MTKALAAAIAGAAFAVLAGATAVSAQPSTLRIAAASTAGLAPAVRVNPPIVNQSNCRDLGTPSALTITMPAISYSCPVYAGGQATIDDGTVALVTEVVNDRIATHPGQAGTLWIAAHRTTHGGSFAAVPDLADGALVTIGGGTTSATYRVVARSYVTVDATGHVLDAAGNGTALATWQALLRDDLGGPTVPARLALQTCDGANNRWMVYADLVTG